MTREFKLNPRKMSTEGKSASEDACSKGEQFIPEEEIPQPLNSAMEKEEVDSDKKLEEKQREVDNYKDALLRAMSDLENYKKRTQRERAEIRNATIAEIMETLLPVLDNFEFGLAACAQQESKGVAEGFRMIFVNFQNLLSSYGLEEIYPLNEKFDANFHDCVHRVLDSDRENDTVISVDRKGYKLNGKLLRPAIVAVSYCAEQEKEDREGHE